MITAFYAGIFGLFHLGLTLYVIFGRWRFEVSLGDGGERYLRRRIRAHGNFTENVPIALILMYFAEMHLLESYWIHLCGIGLIISRTLHFIGFIQDHSTNRYRQVGMALTMMIIGLISSSIVIGLAQKVIVHANG